MNRNVFIVVIVALLLLGVGGVFIIRSKTIPDQSAQPFIAQYTASPTAMPTPLPTESTAAATLNDSVVITLAEQNKSGEFGTATLKEVNGKTVVTLSLNEATTSAQPAHIHTGKCPEPGAVKYPLTNVVNGKSETTINTSLQTLQKQLPLAINVHKSVKDIKTYVSCGDVTFNSNL